MIYSFNKKSDILKRIFIGSEHSFWEGRPIYDRLPSANQQYNTANNRFNDEGNVLLRTTPDSTTFGEGTLQVQLENKYLLKINSGVITWQDGETFVRELLIGVSSNEDKEWTPNTFYDVGEVIYHDNILYTSQKPHTSDVFIDFDLQDGNLFRGALGEGEQYVWFELFKYRPSATLRVSIPDEILDLCTITASRSSILSPPRYGFDNVPSNSWTPPSSLNLNDNLTLTFDGFVNLESFTLTSNFTNGPTARLSFRTGDDGEFITITNETLQDTNGVWDFSFNPVDRVHQLRITFTGSNSLDVRSYSIGGSWLQSGVSSVRNQFLAFRTSAEYDMDDLDVIGSCVLAQVLVNEFGEIVQINDTRSLTFDRNESVADWLTVYWDELLIRSRQKIETFIADYLKPNTAGKYLYEDQVNNLTMSEDKMTATISYEENIITPFGYLS